MRSPFSTLLVPATAVLVSAAIAWASPNDGTGEDAGVQGAVDSVQRPERILLSAISFLGTACASGGVGPGSYDCSGLVCRTFRDAAGIELSRGVDGLFASGRTVEAPLHIGDLVFFDTLEGGARGRPDHVGIYAGSGAFVHAVSEGPRPGGSFVVLTAFRAGPGAPGAAVVVPGAGAWRVTMALPGDRAQAEVSFAVGG